MSEKSTLHKTVELMVEGVPAGTPKAAVLIETDVEPQRSPAVASDCRSGISSRTRGSVRGSSQGCGTSGGLGRFVDRRTREPEAPAGYQQPENQ